MKGEGKGWLSARAVPWPTCRPTLNHQSQLLFYSEFRILSSISLLRIANYVIITLEISVANDNDNNNA